MRAFMAIGVLLGETDCRIGMKMGKQSNCLWEPKLADIIAI